MNRLVANVILSVRFFRIDGHGVGSDFQRAQSRISLESNFHYSKLISVPLSSFRRPRYDPLRLLSRAWILKRLMAMLQSLARHWAQEDRRLGECGQVRHIPLDGADICMTTYHGTMGETVTLIDRRRFDVKFHQQCGCLVFTQWPLKNLHLISMTSSILTTSRHREFLNSVQRPTDETMKTVWVLGLFVLVKYEIVLSNASLLTGKHLKVAVYHVRETTSKLISIFYPFIFQISRHVFPNCYQLNWFN